MDAGSPLRRPIPVARSILWAHPLGGGVRPAEIPFPIFLSQVALTAISEHVATPLRAGQGVLGFLLGDLCECPETNVSYLVIDAALRLNQAIHGDRSRDVVTRLWDKIEAQLAEQQAHLIGRYHTHAPLPLTLSDPDAETHEHYFAAPCQVAMLPATDPAVPAAASATRGAHHRAPVPDDRGGLRDAHPHPRAPAFARVVFRHEDAAFIARGPSAGARARVGA